MMIKNMTLWSCSFTGINLNLRFLKDKEDFSGDVPSQNFSLNTDFHRCTKTRGSKEL